MKIKEIYKENNLYPMMLKKIKNPPEKLYVLGNVNLLNEECLYAETESIGVVFRTPNGLRRSLGEGKHH